MALAVLTAGLVGCAGQAPQDDKPSAPDAALGIDAEFGVETFALAAPKITVTDPANYASFTLSTNGGTTNVDFTYTTTNYTGSEVHCYVDTTFFGTFTIGAPVTFTGLTKGTHTLACVLLDASGQDMVDPTGAAQAARQVKIVAPCTKDADCNDDDGSTEESCYIGFCKITLLVNHCKSKFDCAPGANCLNPGTGTSICSVCAQDTDCNDGNICTTDTCDLSGFTGVCHNNKENPDCCVATTDPCSDNKPCTIDECVVTKAGGTCKHTMPVGSCCLESDCSSDDVCQFTSCVGFKCRFQPDPYKPDCCSDTTNSDCNDANICTIDACTGSVTTNGVTWAQCSHVKDPSNPLCCDPKFDLCDDGDSCTADMCFNNQCQHTVLKDCCKIEGDSACDDNNICTADACDVPNHTCTHDFAKDCCNVLADCDDNHFCTTDTCDKPNHQCSHSAPAAGCCELDSECNDGKACTDDACFNHGCVGLIKPGCCEASTAATICNDKRTCTIDSCDLTTNKCVNLPNGVTGCCDVIEDCDDGDCGTLDTCDSTHHCTHKPDPYVCKTDSQCDDGVVCTTDKCDKAANGCGTCSHTVNAGCCNDDAFCVAQDQADDAFAAVCHIATCNLATHICSIADNPTCCQTDKQAQTKCDDANPCTIEYCANNQCRHSLPTNGCCINDQGCDDGAACSQDSCLKSAGAISGTCKHVLPQGCVVCSPTNTPSDNNVCTTDSCVNSVPVYTPIAGCCLDKTDCDDKKPCTADDCVNHVCYHADSVLGVSVCCNPTTEATECAGYNSDCTVGKCLTQPDGTLGCQAVKKPACVVNLSYCQDFSQSTDLSTLGWEAANVSGTAATNWGTATTGNLGPDRYANFNWTPTKVGYDTCLQSPVFLGAGTSGITLQYDREFLPNIGETSIRVLGSLDGSYVDWTTATVLDTLTTTSGVGPETLELKLPSNLVGSNGLRLAFCVSGASTFNLSSFAIDNVCVGKGSPPQILACPTNQVVPTGTKTYLPIKVKDPDVGDIVTATLVNAPPFVTLSSFSYYFFDKSYNGSLLIAPTSLQDLGEYKIGMKISDGYLYHTCSFTVTVTYLGGTLIWRPMDDTHAVPAVMSDTIKTALAKQGQITQVVRDLALYPVLNKFSAIFITLGNYPDNHVLTNAEISSLQAYLSQGGKVYMEGGDTFMYDPKTNLHPFFKVKGILDDAPNGVTGPLAGYAAFADKTLNPVKHYGWNFNQDPTFDNLNDQIASDTSFQAQRTRDLLRNNGIEKFTVMVGHDDITNKYRTIASSVPFAGITAGTDTPDTMMKAILAFFGNGFGSCFKNADCDDGNGCTTDTCTAGECSNTNVCLCGGDTSLGCGDVATKIVTNSGASTNVVTTYTCDPETQYPGHEVAFQYKSTQSRPVTVTLSNVSNSKARLFVIKATTKGCDPDGCIGFGGVSQTVTFAAGKGQIYYLVVDVADDTKAAQFDIAVTCGDGENCTDGIDNNQNNLIDCADTSTCCGDPACSKETCDGIDNNCDGIVDEGCDDDGDGYCDATYVVKGAPAVCWAGTGDCNDNDATVSPGMQEYCNGKDDNCVNGIDEENSLGCVNLYRDGDNDNWGAGLKRCLCAPSGQYKAFKAGDCNDSNVDVNPDVTETCATTYDDNCDGNANNVGADGCINFYTDYDDDGYGSSPFRCQCYVEGLFKTTKGGDCQVNNANVNPGAKEKCNNIDDDCNGITDDGCDDDGDLYCDADIPYDTSANPVLICPLGPGDSDDNDPAINPKGKEICDGKDNNSNGQTDELCDKDSDGYCDADIFTIGKPKSCPNGGGDCDDATPSVNPGMHEDCNTPYDDNCTFNADGTRNANDVNADNCNPLFNDADNDKYGTSLNKCLCTASGLFRATNPGDCNEGNPAINPGAAEICDGIDNNCDGATDEGCDVDGDGYCHSGAIVVGTPDACKNGINDCDDTLATGASVNPGKVEICGNGKDDNCNGTQNDQDALFSVPFYQDLDGDGYGSTYSAKFCSPSGTYTATNSADCDDSRKAVNPAATEICNNLDDNCANGTDEGCDDDGDHQCDANMGFAGPVTICSNGGGDCNDNDGNVFKGKSQEVCDNVDDNCNGKTDEGCDDDHDGYCDILFTVITPLPTVCPKGTGDCDDQNSDQNPGANEICGNGLDDNCNGSQNDLNAGGCTNFYFDSDNDTFGVANSSAKCLCVAAGNYRATQAGDCADTAAAIHPGVTEVCDGADNNCDGNVDENGATGCVVRYYDYDQDTYGINISQCSCSATAPFTATQTGDCDDTSAAKNPGQTEKCDNIDNNCNTKVDEGCNADGDQFCTTSMTVVGLPAVCVLGGGDCNDSDAAINPGATEVCDGKDNNCASVANTSVNDANIEGGGTGHSPTNFAAQKLVAGIAGTIASVDIYVNTLGNAITMDMYVYAGGLPGAGGTQLGAKTSASITSGNFAKVTFTPTAGSMTLAAGQTYYLVFNTTSAAAGMLYDDTQANLYAAGQAYFASTLTGSYTALTGGTTDIRLKVAVKASVAIDEGCDDDADTYCDANMTTIGTPASCTHGGNDCDDTNPAINPGAAEVCGNTVDENCSGGYNDLNAQGCTQFFADYDGDTWGKGSSAFQKAIINEIHYSSTTGFASASAADSIEILVTADWTPGDMAGIYFGDSQAAGTSKVGAFHLNLAALGITTLKAGTIINVAGPGALPQVGGVGTEDTTYNPAANDWNLQLNGGGAYVLTDSPGADLGLVDVAWIDTSYTGTTSIDSWAYGIGSSGALGSAAKVTLNAPPTSSLPFVVFTGDIGGRDIATNYSLSATGSPGLPNGGKNTTFVNFLRTMSSNGSGQCLCTGVAPYTATKGGDCDDGNASSNPGLPEFCDGVDNNCNGVTDEGCDDDNDGYCDGSMTTIGTANGLCSGGGGDCNDTNAAIHPGATDICGNATDFNCDGVAGSGTGGATPTNCTTYYWDGDGDGVGVNVSQCVCSPSGKYTASTNNDCDDTNANIYPGVGHNENCATAYDDNCNGTTNDVGALNCIAYYKDADLDGYGANGAATSCQCAPEGQYIAAAAGDCNDANGKVFPGATEICDAIDNNCNVAGGNTNYVDANQPNGNVTSHSLVNYVAQSFVAQHTGALASVDVWLTTTQSITFTMSVYTGAPGTGTLVGSVQSTTVPAQSNAKFNFPATGINLTAGTTYWLVFHTATASQLFTEYTTSDAYASGSLTFATTLTGTYGSYAAAYDMQFDVNVTVTGSATVIDEGCDDDADTYCDATMYITSAATCTASAKPAAGQVKLGDDCNDTSASAHPGGTEVCDGIDNNCDSYTDDGCDADKDGYCATTRTIAAGGFGAGTTCFNQATTGAGTDCNDANPLIYPGKTEACDGVDNNCAGGTDENCDKDGDTYCDSTMTTVKLAGGAAWPSVCVNGGGDCADTNTAANKLINPGATEICDGIDNNCVGGTDEGCNDNDGDGYCNGNVAAVAGSKCPNGGGDCNDTDASVHPGVTEICGNGKDDNCNGTQNDVNASGCVTYYADVDQDGYGSSSVAGVCQCFQNSTGSFTATVAGDCADSNVKVNPGAVEVCDAIDNNCNVGGGTTVYVDANQPNGSAISHSVTNWLSQSFLAVHTGQLTSIDLWMKTPAITLNVYVYTGAPGTGTLVGSMQTLSVPALASTTKVNFPFTGINVTAGTTYYLLIHSPSGLGSMNISDYATSDVYTSGALVWSTTQTGTYGAFSGTYDLQFDVNVSVTTSAVTVDEGCDVDGDKHCSSAMLVTSTATCNLNLGFPSGTATVGGDDCDDNNAAVYGGKAEICDNIDNNCSGTTDEVCDQDGDGYCAATAIMAPGVTVAKCPTLTPVAPATGTTFGNDCNDGSAVVHPGNAAVEDCATPLIDENCNGNFNDNNATHCTTYYTDADGDGVGVAALPGCYCSPSSPFTSLTVNDCNDADPAIKSSATEICDGKDNNCNGVTDEGCDDDGDLYCDSAMTIASTATCSLSSKPAAGSTKAGDDCDDGAKTVNPGATEWCDGVDNNCVSGIDEACDADGDGYCSTSAKIIGTPAKCPNGGGDCNDANSLVKPSAQEVCSDNIDNNCDGLTDSGTLLAGSGCTLYYQDADKDGYGINSTACYCANKLPAANTTVFTLLVLGALDCQDTGAGAADRFPGHVEWCDGVDNDCNGTTDDSCNVDNDGYCSSALVTKGTPPICNKGGGDCNDNDATINPGYVEACDGKDNNCNGTVDDAVAAADWCVNASNPPGNTAGPYFAAKGSATVSCTSGACTLGACATNFANLDGNNTNGCECNTTDTYEPTNDTCPGVQIGVSGGTLSDTGNASMAAGSTGQVITLKGSMILPTDNDWYYFYGADVVNTYPANGLDYDLYTVRAYLGASPPSGVVMEVFRAGDVASLCNTTTYGTNNFRNTANAGAPPANPASNIGNTGVHKPAWNSLLAVGNTWLGASMPTTTAPVGTSPNRNSAVCCGDTDFWWYTSFSTFRNQGGTQWSNVYSEYGEWPCWAAGAEMWDQGDCMSTTAVNNCPGSPTSPTFGNSNWYAQGAINRGGGSYPAALPTNASAVPSTNGNFPNGFDVRRCTDDSAYYAIHIYRSGGTTGACTPYTLEVSNGVYPAAWYGRADWGKVGP